MKPILKVLSFLLLVTILDFLLRKGLLGHFIPFSLHDSPKALILYTLFAGSALYLTKRFAKSDQWSLKDLGITLGRKNRSEFWLGLLVGIILWGIVSLSQGMLAGFSWSMRPDFNPLTLIYGLFFIFIADLGTELYMRGYPVTKLKQNFGAVAVVGILSLFEIAKGLLYNMGSELMFYAVLIPVLHTIFFSFIYLKTKRLGAALGLHTGANFITISIFDLRATDPDLIIPSGIFQSDTALESMSIHALQLPWVAMAAILSIATYFWWSKRSVTPD